jgi:pilus assembly protein CpaF
MTNPVFDELMSFLDAKRREQWLEHEDISGAQARELIDRFHAHHHTRQDIRERIERELFGDGPLHDLVDAEDLTEIMINDHDNIWYERAGEVRRLSENFFSARTYRGFVERMLKEMQKNLDQNFAALDGRWRNFRVNILSRPLVEGDFVVTLRRQAAKVFSLEDYHRDGWGSVAQLEWIRKQVRARRNILIVGNTGSGKTTLLNTLLAQVPPDERVVIIEDTPEIRPPNALALKLLTRRDSQGLLKTFDQSDLVIQSLRLRPDRLVVGEMRGPEAKDFLMALSTGHPGSMATIHADDPAQALLRLEMLVQLGAPQWNIQSVRQLIRMSVHYLVVVQRKANSRLCSGIYRISSLEEFGFLVDPVRDLSVAPGATKPP